MSRKVTKKHGFGNDDGLKQLVDELTKFADEFDTSDPEAVQVSLDEHLSNLIKQGFLKKVRGQAPQLEDALGQILGDDVAEGFIEHAETFRELINSYGDEPSERDMEEAYNTLDTLLAELRGRLREQAK